MSYTPNGSKISTINSTTNLLPPSGTYTGTWEDINNFVSISINCYADSAGTLYAQFSDNANTNLKTYRNVQLSNGANGSMGLHTLAKIARYFRIQVVNGITTQTDFAATTIYSTNPLLALPTSRLAQEITNYSPVLNTRGAIFGETEGGGFWQSISAEAEGHLEVSVQQPRTAFGEISVAPLTAKAQVDFVYGINSNLGFATATGIGSVFVTSGLLSVTTGAATTSSSKYETKRYVKYKPGQGSLARFTALFTTGINSSYQLAGIGDSIDGFFFGCIGTQFGVVHRNNSVQTFVPQSSWENDVMNGVGGSFNKSGVNLNYTKGNVYQIKYQYLGFGNIYFFIENPLQGQFVLVHTITYPNANVTQNLRNPSLPFIIEARNYDNAINLTAKTASIGLFIEGDEKFLGPLYGANNNKAAITTETNILSLKNCTSLNGIINRSIVYLNTVSYSSSAASPNGVVTLKIVKNATLGGSPNWIAEDGVATGLGTIITNGQSGISTDVAGTTVSGGVVVYNGVSFVSGNVSQTVSDLNLFIAPGETFTVSMQSTQSATCAAAITWTEDI